MTSKKSKKMILLMRAFIGLAMVMVLLMDFTITNRVNLSFVFFCLLTLYFMRH